MKLSPLIHILLLIVICLGRPPACPATETTRTLTTNELESIFSEIIMANSPWHNDELQINNFSARPLSVTVPINGVIDYEITQKPSFSHLGKKIISIDLLVDGNKYSQVKMLGDLALLGEIACLNKRLSRGDIITNDDVAMIRHDISMLDSGIIREADLVIGKKLKTSLRAGAILYSHLVEAPPLVKRGDLVTIMARTDNLRVTVPGEVRDNGARGEVVKVKNLMSRHEIYARVINPGIVETEF